MDERSAGGSRSRRGKRGVPGLRERARKADASSEKRGTTDTAILFTDLVGFSSWALEAGDEAAVRLLREVGAVEEDAISAHGGIVVKRLGDGAMAVFSHPAHAVRSARDIQERLRDIDADSYSPRLRAGIHLGRPQKVRRDYLGVDVNIAARVGDAAEGEEILVSDAARALLAPD